MFMFIHALLGGVIGNEFSSILFIVAIAIASHFIIDLIPHWDIPFNKKKFHKTGKVDINKFNFFVISLDFLFTIALIFLLFFKFDSRLMVFGAVASISPDLIKAGYFTKLKKRKSYNEYLQFHSRIQKKADWKIGLLTQIAVLVALYFILF